MTPPKNERQTGWFPVSISLVLLVPISPDALPVQTSPDSKSRICNPEPGNTTLWLSPQSPSAIHAATLCNWGKNSPTLFGVSKALWPDQRHPQIERETVLQLRLATFRDGRGEDKQSTPSILLLPTLGSSIRTAVAFVVLRVRRAAKMELPPTQPFLSQNIQVSLLSPLLGLWVAIFLSLLEVSLRYL